MIDLELARLKRRSAEKHRRKGDALLNRTQAPKRADDRDGIARAEEAAHKEYREGVSELDEALSAVGLGPPSTLSDDVLQPLLSDGGGHWSAEAAETLGSHGGLLRRLGKLDDALQSYAWGAAIEKGFRSPTTYNRANAMKLSLLTGARTLREERPNILALRDLVERSLSTDETAADDAWLWADLGDYHLLLGDVGAARKAYEVFVTKAETQSPRKTLRVLHELRDAIDRHGDPDAPRIRDAVSEVESVLAA